MLILTRKVGESIRNAISSYATEVRNRTFPAPEHTYAVKDDAGAAKVSAKAKTKA